MTDTDNKILSGITFSDLFAGLGGFRVALESLGAKCVYASEWDKSVREVYFRNFGEYPDGDITQINEYTIPDHDILCAGFPCQAFSVSGKQKGFEDSRGTLFFDVARIVKAKKPKAVFMENVKNFAFHNNGNTLETVKRIMEEYGYTFYYKVLNASDYGVPQNRERIYMVCFRNDIKSDNFCYPEPIELKKHTEDILLQDESLVCGLYTQRDDISVSLERETEYSSKPVRIGTVNKGGQGERIYSIKGTAITISASGGGVFAKTGGYLINGKVRKLHPRECARLMGYPDSYVICEKAGQAYKQLGNSVVIDVLQMIGAEIGKVLE